MVRFPSLGYQLFIQMCSTYRKGWDALFGINKYHLHAIEYARGMCCAVQSCSEYQYSVYIINKSDLTCQQRADIERLAINDPARLDDEICDAIFLIYDSDSDLRLIYSRFMQGRKLRWRLEN